MNVGMVSPAIAEDDTVYVVAKRAFAFNPAGTPLYSVDPEGLGNMESMNAPIIDTAGNLYFSAKGKVYSLYANGNTRWIYDPGTGMTSLSSLAFNKSRTALIAPIGVAIYKINVSDGTLIWSFSPPGAGGQFRATRAVDASDNIYLGTKNDDASVFYAIKADGSGLLWQNPIGKDLYSSPLLGNDGVLYVASEQLREVVGMQEILSDFCALSMATGERLWSNGSGGINGGCWASTPFFANGMVYSPQRYRFVAFSVSSTGMDIDAASGKFRATNENTGRYP